MTLLVGTGEPVTLVANGLGASVAETRPLLSGVWGTKAFVLARGHGAPWTGTPGYQQLADDLLAAADEVGATQALGVSLGAGALLRLLSQHPARLSRVVLYLPAALNEPSPSAVRRGGALAAGLRARDVAAVEAVVRDELPTDLTGPSVESYVAARTGFLLASDLVPLLEALATDFPVPDGLGAVTADVLVIGQEDDPVHPASVAREIAAALPRARCVVFARSGALFRERRRLRELIVGHLAEPTG